MNAAVQPGNKVQLLLVMCKGFFWACHTNNTIFRPIELRNGFLDGEAQLETLVIIKTIHTFRAFIQAKGYGSLAIKAPPRKHKINLLQITEAYRD